MPHWTCLLRLLSCISGFMKATTKPGDRYESWFPFYARGLFRGKGNESPCPDRSVTHPSAAPAQAGVADEGSLSADTTAQERPIGYPNEPGILRGLAQRCGRALTQLQKRGVQGLDCALEQMPAILRSDKALHLFAKYK